MECLYEVTNLKFERSMLYYKIFTLHIDPTCHTDYLFCNLSCLTEVWYNALMQGYGKCRHLQCSL